MPRRWALRSSASWHSLPRALRLVGPARLRRQREDQKTAVRGPQSDRDGVGPLTAGDANFNRLQRAHAHPARNAVNELASGIGGRDPTSHFMWQFERRRGYRLSVADASTSTGAGTSTRLFVAEASASCRDGKPSSLLMAQSSLDPKPNVPLTIESAASASDRLR